MELKNQIAQTLAKQALIVKPYTLAELMHQATPLLKKMQKNGHSIEEMSEIFNQHQITIPHLKELLQPQKSKASKKASRKKSTQLDKQLAQIVAEEVVQKILAQLKQQSEIRKGLTRQELVRDLLDPITAMLEARYSYEEIAEFFREQGVSITAGTLKTYYKAAKRGDKGKGRQGDEGKENFELISPSLPLSQSPSLKTESTRNRNRFPESTSTDQLASEFNL